MKNQKEKRTLKIFSNISFLRPYFLAHVKKWKKEIDSKVVLPNSAPIPVVLLANKCDLEVDIDREMVCQIGDIMRVSASCSSHEIEIKHDWVSIRLPITCRLTLLLRSTVLQGGLKRRLSSTFELSNRWNFLCRKF
jgi:hypothetical protein